MKESIKDILRKHGIVDKELTEELGDLYTTCIKASRSLGAKSVQSLSYVAKEMEPKVWREIEYAMIDVYDIEKKGDSFFADVNLERLKQKYGFYIKNNGNNIQSPPVYRETGSQGYSLQLLSDIKKKQTNHLSVASLNKLSFRKAIDGPFDSRHPH